MEDQVEIMTTGAVEASIRPPGSKSITNRALVCAALASGTSYLRGALASEDTEVMMHCLQQLGIEVEHHAAKQEMRVVGTGGSVAVDHADLFVANSGTTIRFLTAMVSLLRGAYRLDGIERMRERPIGDLLDALNQLGTDARSENENRCPPVVVSGVGLNGGDVSIRGNISSQYLSGLMMAAPYAKGDVTIRVDGELVSKPYIEITKRVMADFGIDVENGADFETIRVAAPQAYIAREFDIEPDASAASYFWAAAAITGGQVTVEGLSFAALQGDVQFCRCLEKMGCQVAETELGIRVIGKPLRGIDVDMNAISDTVQTLAAVALFAEGPTRIRGVAHNRHKETDRIGDLATELRKFGAGVREFDDGLEISPSQLSAATIETYNDHRMAMSLSLVGLKVPSVVILNPGCTSKTYPQFFDDLSRVSGG